MSRYWSKTVRELEPYVPGEQPKDQQYIKLNTNENPYPPSPKVIQAIKEAANETLKLYPDPNCEELRMAIAEYYQIEKENVFVGNGSDEVLALIFLTFFQQDHPILFPDVTYSFYKTYCEFFCIQATTIPVTSDFRICLEEYSRVNGGIIFPNPNAVTGRSISLQEIETLLLANKNSVVAIDEAYIDFGGETAITLIKRFPNVLVIQTLSKSRSLAGLRIGFAIGNEELIDGLERAKNSFNSYTLDRLTLAGGVAAMKDEEYFQSTRQKVINTREWMAEELSALGCSIIPSHANFVLIQHDRIHAKHLYEELKKQGILVRYIKKPRVNNYVRVSIGTDIEMKIFLEKIRGVF
jgi:histidinol-phosphate aminotransferase